MSRWWAEAPLLVKGLRPKSHCSGQWLAEGAPGMETAGKGMLFIALADKAQVAGPLMLFGAHVLDVHLGRKNSGLQKVFQYPQDQPQCHVHLFLLTWQAFRLSLIST